MGIVGEMGVSATVGAVAGPARWGVANGLGASWGAAGGSGVTARPMPGTAGGVGRCNRSPEAWGVLGLGFLSPNG